MRRSLVPFALLTVVAFPMLFAVPAQAASAGSCAIDAAVSITPGVSMTPTRGTVAGSGGTIACVGVFNGVKVAGKGTLSVSGNYGNGTTSRLQGGDTCGQGSGGGSLTAVLPKVGGGMLRVVGSFKFVRVGAAVAVNGTIAGAAFAGGLGFAPPPSQNCARVRVTKATVAGTVAIG